MGQALNTRTPKYNGGDKGCQKKKSQGKNARRKRLEERGYQEKGILRGRNDKYSEARSFFGTASCLSPELAPSCLAIHYDVRCRIDALKASPAAGHCFSGKTDGKRGSHFQGAGQAVAGYASTLWAFRFRNTDKKSHGLHARDRIAMWSELAGGARKASRARC